MRRWVRWGFPGQRIQRTFWGNCPAPAQTSPSPWRCPTGKRNLPLYWKKKRKKTQRNGSRKVRRETHTHTHTKHKGHLYACVAVVPLSGARGQCVRVAVISLSDSRGRCCMRRSSESGVAYQWAYRHVWCFNYNRPDRAYNYTTVSLCWPAAIRRLGNRHVDAR